MEQLSFSYLFDEIVENSFLDTETTPNFIKDYVQNKLISNHILVTGEKCNCFRCPSCLEGLNDSSICPKCEKDYSKDIDLYFLDENGNYDLYLYYFDIYKKNVFLHGIIINLHFDIELKTRKINFKTNEILLIKKDGIYDCLKNEYKNYDEFIPFEAKDYQDVFLYPDNIEELKNNEIYKYSYLWELKDTFNSNNPSFKNLVIYPILHKEFEYLIKQKFYSIAINSTDKISYKGSFFDTFKVSKDRINRFNRKEMSIGEIKVLSRLDIKNRELLHFIGHYSDNETFIKYLEDKNYNTRNLRKYINYISTCMDLYESHSCFLRDLNKKNSYLYPDYLDNLSFNISKIIENENQYVDISIKEIGNLLTINNYEDNDYIIRPIMSLEDLIKEASMQRNCLARYYKEIIEGKSQIYVMRDKNKEGKSLISIEVVGNKIKNAKAKFNKDVPKDLMKVIDNWEKSLIQVLIN